MQTRYRILITVAMGAMLSSTALAAEEESMDEFSLKPIAELRLRYEGVDQPASDADAVTARARAGVEGRSGDFSFLVEGEATLALINSYNAFPFPVVDAQRRPQYSVVADPENIELNRLQIAYKQDGSGVTAGRQRINLDDQRWVGSVGWRQNEQTFDAIRGEAKLGDATLDLTYSNSQRTIFGSDAGPRTALGGDFVFAGAGTKLGPINAKAFAYLVDYEEPFLLTNSSQSYGVLLSGAVPLGETAKLNVKVSYARQSDLGSNPNDYAADYWLVEAGTEVAGFGVTAGCEKLGSDNGTALQTALATLHKFNGWADLFLTTPAGGVEDKYAKLKYSFGSETGLAGLNLNLAYHQFDSDIGGIEYGHEWDASAGFKLGNVGLLAKFARYEANMFGVDTSKMWIEANWSF